MTKLKRCPFCGGEATASEMQDTWQNDTGHWYISCDDCSCCIGGYGEFTTEQEAIEAWNHRIGDANKTIENVVTCGECKYFERLSPDSINGYCTSEDVASDDEGGACFSCSRGEDDYCSFGWKGKIN